MKAVFPQCSSGRLASATTPLGLTPLNRCHIAHLQWRVRLTPVVSPTAWDRR